MQVLQEIYQREGQAMRQLHKLVGWQRRPLIRNGRVPRIIAWQRIMKCLNLHCGRVWQADPTARKSITQTRHVLIAIYGLNQATRRPQLTLYNARLPRCDMRAASNAATTDVSK